AGGERAVVGDDGVGSVGEAVAEDAEVDRGDAIESEVITDGDEVVDLAADGGGGVEVDIEDGSVQAEIGVEAEGVGGSDGSRGEGGGTDGDRPADDSTARDGSTRAVHDVATGARGVEGATGVNLDGGARDRAAGRGQ